jgi:hypothetical protein
MKLHVEQTFTFDMTGLTIDEAEAVKTALETLADMGSDGELEVDFECNSGVHKLIKKMAVGVAEALNKRNWRE